MTGRCGGGKAGVLFEIPFFYELFPFESLFLCFSFSMVMKEFPRGCAF